MIVSALLALAGFALLATPQARAGSGECPERRVSTADGCLKSGAAADRVTALLRDVREQEGLKALIARVDIGRDELLTVALGQSQAGVPATEGMHFRIGSMAIPYLTTILLQLQERGRLSLDDKLSNWFPQLPRADRIDLRMLANNTSGYYDYIQGNEAFQDLFYADVFRRWRPAQLLGHALARGFACEPGTCFNYAHTNYIVLSRVLRAVTGKPTRELVKKRIFAPLGLRETEISAKAPIPDPVLHAYSSDRGPYEDSTSWSPSWTLGNGTIMTSTIDDIARTARAIGTGELLSRRARKQQVAPYTVGKSGMTEELYFGLGLLVSNRWRLQNPFLNGYSGAMAYLPSRKLAIAVTATMGQAASTAPTNYGELAFARVAAYLAPDNPPQTAP